MESQPTSSQLGHLGENLHRLHIPQRYLVAAGVALLGLGIAAGVANHAWQIGPVPASTSIDLLQQNWRYVDGVTQTDSSLVVTPTDSRIVKQDGSGGQTNPPLNLYGFHLKNSGDFSITAHLSNRGNGNATIRLYNAPPIVADEFRVEPASLEVTEHGSTLSLQAWNGSRQTDVANPQPVFTKQANLDAPDSDITLTRSGKTISIRAGSTTLTAGTAANVLRSGNLWFGLSSPDSGFSVDKLTASGNVALASNISTPNVAQVASGLQSLASQKRSGFKVGAAVALGPITSESTYATELQQNFGSITLENALKPQFIAPKQGVYTFQEADAIIDYAHKHGMSVHGHTLAFSEAEPTWMRNLPTATLSDRQATSAILLDYVTHVTKHFKGQLDSFDVINEPLDTDQGTSLQQNIWYKAMGPDYMTYVSQAVHAADPHVKQYVNENGAEMAGDRQDTLLALVQHINSQGGYIYGVGLQAHVYDIKTDALDSAALNTTFNRFGSAGLKVRISENDVSDDSGTKAQAAQYGSIFSSCLQNKNCVSYTTWGVDDRYDWFIDDDGSLQQGHDLLFNAGKQTAAYKALLAAAK